MGVLIFILIAIFFVCVTSNSSTSKQREQQKIALQNYVSTPHPRLILTDKELQRAANSYMNKCRRAMERCLEAMQKATNPKTYFQKFNDYEGIKKDIEGLKNVWIGTFSVKFPIENEITQLTNAMIDRYWISCKEKSIKAVSEKSKRNACQAFFDTFDLYSEYLSQANIDHIEFYRSEFRNMFLQNTIEISR